MRQLLFLIFLVSHTALAAEQQPLKNYSGIKTYFCHRAFIYALNACSGDPWSCAVSAPYKNGFYSWWYKNQQEISEQKAKITNQPLQNSKILRVVMDALAEDARTPNKPGRLHSVANFCGISRDFQPLTWEESEFMKWGMSKESRF